MGFAGGGFFGSGGKDIDTTTTTENDVDNISVEADGGGLNINNVGDIKAGIGSSVSFSTTDFGALDAASALADRALESVDEVVRRSNETTSNAVSNAVKVAQSATQDEAARTQQFLILGGVFAIVAVAFVVYRKGRK